MRLYYQTAGMMPEQQMTSQTPQGGVDPSIQMLQAFFEINQMNEQQIQQFMQEFQQMAPEEQEKVMQYIAQQVQGGGQEQQTASEQQMPPQEQMAPEAATMQMGGSTQPEWLRYQVGNIVNESPTYSYENLNDNSSLMAADAAYPEVQRLPQYQPMVAPITTVTGRLGLVTPENAVVASPQEAVTSAPKRKTFDPAVQALQKQLIKEGYNLGKYGADGIAGKFTKDAIKAKAAGVKPNNRANSEVNSPITKRDAKGKVVEYRNSRTNEKGELPEFTVTSKGYTWSENPPLKLKDGSGKEESLPKESDRYKNLGSNGLGQDYIYDPIKNIFKYRDSFTGKYTDIYDVSIKNILKKKIK